MRTDWLANADPGTFWANHAWTGFAVLPQKEFAVVVLPIHGFADHGTGLPLDQEELLGSDLLRRAVERVSGHFTVRVLPPLRFTLAAANVGCFGVDPDTAHALLREISESVRAAGFQKLVFFNTSAVNEPLVATAALDVRVAFGLRTYVISARSLGLDLARPASAKEAKRVARLAALLGEIRQHLAPPISRKMNDGKRKMRGASVFPAYRDFYLPAFSRAQIDAIPSKERALVVLPMSAIEQHGPHLPTGVDAFLSQALLASALPQAGKRASVYVAPPIIYGKSNEHLGFPGTVTLSAQTLRQIVLAAAAQLRAWGFRRIGLFNTHGGNSTVLAYTARELCEAHGLEAVVFRHGFTPRISEQETQWGFHAGEFETALMLACSPELVRMEKAVCEYPVRAGDPGELRPVRSPAIFAWRASDISTHGVTGDATRATFAKGRRWFASAAASLARRIIELCRA